MFTDFLSLRLWFRLWFVVRIRILLIEHQISVLDVGLRGLNIQLWAAVMTVCGEVR